MLMFSFDFGGFRQRKQEEYARKYAVLPNFKNAHDGLDS
jgi:hypothetical protein